MVPGTETPGQPAQLSGSQHRPPPLAVNGSFRDPSSVNLPSWWQPYTEGNESLGTLSSSQPWKSVQGGPEKNRGPPPLPEDENEGLSLLESLPEDPPQVQPNSADLAQACHQPSQSWLTIPCHRHARGQHYTSTQENAQRCRPDGHVMLPLALSHTRRYACAVSVLRSWPTTRQTTTMCRRATCIGNSS